MNDLNSNKSKWMFIVNSTAGHGKSGQKINQLILNLNRYSFDYEIALTKYPGHAREMARQAADSGFCRIIAVGGDGTANEVVNGIMQSGKQELVVFGMIPEGTGNDFARIFNLPHEIKRAVQRLQQNKIIQLDLGRVEGHYFLNSLGLGFDAVVAKNVNALQHLKGFSRYLVAIAQAMMRYQNYQATLQIGESSRKIDFILFSVGNGQYCGNGFRLTPNAKPDDGLLDIGIVSGLTRKRLLRLLPSARRGKHLQQPEVEVLQAPKFTICAEQPLPLYLDGEIPLLENSNQITVEVLKNSLRCLT
ncbi:MAG: diacylglycerol kinase family lipid kinase [Candidatus Cloacimonadales bacterium]